MISVIVPVYNAERWLRRCLDSICAQTFRDLDIILVDDGSTDGSGRICDEYAGKDPRVRVLHTSNGGLSAARNWGIEEAAARRSPYIAFVDSDDWIEPDMYERLLGLARECGADVAECGLIREYAGRRIRRYPEAGVFRKAGEYNLRALYALLSGRLHEGVPNKLWKAGCFRNVRFPEGRNCEEIALTYLLLENAETVAGISRGGYHYYMRKGSLDHTPSLKMLTDLWTANRDKYFHIRDTVVPAADPKSGRELLSLQLKNCANAILRNWAWRWKQQSAGEDGQAAVVREMRDFSRENIPLTGRRTWPLRLRMFVFLTRHDRPFAFFAVYCLNIVRRKLSFRRLYPG